jgi:hypothetical protein
MKSKSSSLGKEEMSFENLIEMFEQLEKVAMSDDSETSRVRSMISIMIKVLGNKQS